MSEEAADLRRQVSRMTTQLQRLESASRQTWAFPTTVSAATSSLWLVIGGNVLLSPAGPGIARRLDAVAASELPNGAAGTGVIIVPPNAAMPVLPNGFGVAQRYDGTDLTWVLLDSSTSAVVPDLIGNNDVILTATTGTIDKVSGPTTWRYNFIRPVGGWW